MNDQERESALILTSRIIRFATDHPYAATGLFGAAVGSAITYNVLAMPERRSKAAKIFSPKVYEFAITPEDLRRMLADPTTQIRYETTDMSVIVTSEQREQFKALPDIEQGGTHGNE